MNINQRIQYHKQLEENNINLSSKLKNQIYTIGTLRLVTFIIAATGIFFYWNSTLVAIIFALVGTILFTLLLNHHSKLSQMKEMADTLALMAKNELKAFNHDFSPFDNAAEKTDPHHPFSFDLDIFGDGSVFQLLNRTSTPNGKEYLANILQNPLKTAFEIEERQQAVRELSKDDNFCLTFRAIGLLTPHSDLNVKKAKNPKTIQKTNLFWKVSVYAIPIIYLIFIVLQITNVVSGTMVPLYLATLILSIFPMKKAKIVLQSFEKKTKTLQSYAKLFKLTEDANFKSKRLKSLQKQLSNHKKASEAILQLSKHSMHLELSFMFPVFLVLNPFLLWNVLHIWKIEKWANRYAHKNDEWFAALAEIDALISLATFTANHPDYHFPTFSDTFEFNAKNMVHPLIEREKSVPNDININNKPFFMIITGANMAGKSTYLRTVGVNHVLASIGSPVCADSLVMYPGSLLTNLRTADSLINNESYFFAELKRLKMIIERLQSHEDGLFIILDEILKGTNSEDKQKGSFALMQRLVKLQGNGIIATHDLALGELENEFPQAVKNFHFDAYITDNTLSFDYRLQKGIAKNMNASFLMKKMGIVE